MPARSVSIFVICLALSTSAFAQSKDSAAAKDRADTTETPAAKTAAAPKLPPVSLKVYGFIELLGWMNQAQFLGNDALLLTMDGEKSSFGLSPRGTRIGTKLSFPTLKKVQLGGVIEVDFFTDYTNSLWAAARPKMRLRHAYIEAMRTWGAFTLGTKIGSTWAVLSPLFPATLNPAAGWAFGNIWQRMPQVQVFSSFKLAKDLKLELKIAAARPMSGASIYATTFLSKEIDAGDAALMPQLHAALDLSGKLGPIGLLVSVGGVYGKENYDDATGITKTTAAGDEYAVVGQSDVWGFMASLKVAHKYAVLQSEYYVGQNLDVFGAQLKSGLAMVQNDAAQHFMVTDGVRTWGGWLQLTVKPLPQLAISGGYGFDDPDEEQADVVVLYDKNEAGWATVSYTFVQRLTIAVGWMQVTTHFHGTDRQVGNSVMSNAKLTF